MDVSNYMYLQGMNGLAMTLKGDKRFYVFGCLLCEQFCQFANRRQDIDQVLLHEISEVLSKNASIRTKLPNAAYWSRKKREEGAKPTCFNYVESDFGTTEKSFTVFFAC